MKRLFIALAFLLLASSAFSATVDLRIKDPVQGWIDADVQGDSAVVRGPGTFELFGKVVNDLEKESTEKTVDAVFILDASGSMSGEISAVKDSIKEIIDYVNVECPGCMRVGIYVLEGGGSGGGFSPKNYCAKNGDRGAINLTTNANKIKNALATVQASCGTEPWANLAHEVLNDSSWGWRPDSVPVIIAISDEPDNGCGNGVSRAINTVKSKSAYFFGIWSDSAGSDMHSVASGLGDRGKVYRYDKANATSQIKDKILKAIQYVLDSDDFLITQEEGEDWDQITGSQVVAVGSHWEVQNVEREGGEATFKISLTTPPTYSQPFVYFQYRLALKGDSSIYDDAWLKVYMNRPPNANINALTATSGTVGADPATGATIPLEVQFNAQGTTDPEGDLDKFEWDCGNGQTFTTYAVDEAITCSYDQKGMTYAVKLEAWDLYGNKGTDTETATTNPNLSPQINSITASPNPAYPTETVTFDVDAADPDGTLVSCTWGFGDGSAPVTVGCDETPTHVYLAKGTFAVSVTAEDNDGETASDSINLPILNRKPNTPSVAVIPPSGGVAPFNADVTGTTTDPDGDHIKQWQFDWTGDGAADYTAPVCATSCETASESHLFSVAGTITPMARARDDSIWSDWGDTTLVVIEPNAVKDLSAEEIWEGETTDITVRCKNPGKDVEIEVYDSNEIVVFTDTYACDGIYTTAPFPDSGAYQLIAREIVGEMCTNCPKTEWFFVKQRPPNIESPETSALAVLIIGFAVLLILEKKKE